MKCAQVRELFGAYWDDETTQAERECLESHFATCVTCRDEYDAFTRSLEVMGSLPRIEASAELLERVLARARRSITSPDRVADPGRRWMPVTAVAVVLALAGALLIPWLGTIRRPPAMARVPSAAPVRVPELVQPRLASGARPSPATRTGEADRSRRAAQALAVIPDSLFDHSEDVEFILDPVMLRRGRAHAITRAPSGVQGEPAVITF